MQVKLLECRRVGKSIFLGTWTPRLRSTETAVSAKPRRSKRIVASIRTPRRCVMLIWARLSVRARMDTQRHRLIPAEKGQRNVAQQQVDVGCVVLQIFVSCPHSQLPSLVLPVRPTPPAAHPSCAHPRYAMSRAPCCAPCRSPCERLNSASSCGMPCERRHLPLQKQAQLHWARSAHSSSASSAPTGMPLLPAG